MRGAELAVKQRNGMVGGKKIEIIKASSDAKPDVAVNATRKLVEQDKVQITVGPLSGSEGIAVKDYSGSQPRRDLHQRLVGRPGRDPGRTRRPTSNRFNFEARSGWSGWATSRCHDQGLQADGADRGRLCLPLLAGAGLHGRLTARPAARWRRRLGAARREGLPVGNRQAAERRRRAAGRAAAAPTR